MLLNLVARGVLKQGLLYQCLKSSSFFLSQYVKFLCLQQYFSSGAIYLEASFGGGGNGQMSINKGRHLVVKKR